ncbi:MAG: hypothetical protein LW650_09400 [Planctomycetaceae bacterium]|jgi:hypothetical protein|nr:hypothetical protein [Phycisphaerales bacterium]MCE2653687.1 hypothetical protein [Planctomycetaceae bacterium]
MDPPPAFMPEPVATQPPPACPRCGYDLTGQVATWAHACPLAGTCSECGLNFRWSEILGDLNRGPAWLVEHRPRERPSRPRRLWNLYRRCWTTVWQLRRPARFWHSVPMAVPVSLTKLALLALLLVGSLQTIVSLGGLMLTFAVKYGSPRYGFVPTISWINGAMKPWLLITPDADPLVAPMRDSWFVETFGFATLIHMATGPALAVAAVPLLIPTVLLILSHSRATAKVRVTHIVRAAVYGLFPALVLLVIQAAFKAEFLLRCGLNLLFRQPVDGWTSLWSSQIFDRIGPLIFFALAVWSIWYWWCVITRSLQLPRAKLVFALLMLQAVLAAAIALLLDERFVTDYLVSAH